MVLADGATVPPRGVRVGVPLVLDVATGAVERLTGNDAGDFDPNWSPDGEHILFTTSRTGLDELYVMRADGSVQRRLTRFPTESAC